MENALALNCIILTENIKNVKIVPIHNLIATIVYKMENV